MEDNDGQPSGNAPLDQTEPDSYRRQRDQGNIHEGEVDGEDGSTSSGGG